MDETGCARIVWTITKDFSAESGFSGALVLLRNALAEAIFATDGAGFPGPAELGKSDLDTPAWKGCVAAAIEAKSSPVTVAKYLLLWPEGDTGRPAESVPLQWARKGSGTPDPKNVIGPVLDESNRKVWLFAYDGIDTQCALEHDGDAGPGLFPRRRAGGAPSQAARGGVSGGWAWVLFISAVLVGIGTMAWVYGAAELVHGAANRLLEGVSSERPTAEGERTYVLSRKGSAVDALLAEARIKLEQKQQQLDAAQARVAREMRTLEHATDAPLPLGPAAADPQGAGAPHLPGIPHAPAGEEDRPQKQVTDLKAEVTAAADRKLVLECLSQLQARMNASPGEFGTGYCDRALREEWNQSRADIAERADRRAVWLEWLWRASDVRGQISLLLPLGMSALAILMLILSAGIALKATPAGAIIDERNRVSLSRLQQLCWTVVLFGGFTILGIFNISLLADFARDLGQVQALVDVTESDQPTPGFFSLFPSMDPTLWAVLGVTVAVSPYLSARILTEKEVPAGLQADPRTLKVHADPIDRRDAPAEARWADLFKGEGKANAGHVDVSRLQHLVITTLLLGGYVVLLVEYVRTLDATAILMAIMTGAPVFASMPPVDATFVGLLALSHAGYLAFKAMPSAAAART